LPAASATPPFLRLGPSQPGLAPTPQDGVLFRGGGLLQYRDCGGLQGGLCVCHLHPPINPFLTQLSPTQLVPPVGRSPQGWFLQHLDQEEAPRERRSLSRGKRPRSKPVAAHYKVQLPKDPAGINSGPDGTIRGWEETLNATKPLNYNPASGEFDVLRKGLYYLYCQVRGSWMPGFSPRLWEASGSWWLE
uniref:Uncharacterized protein n=1 Tax=Terrapene triunguis TaxID=2587831 RepID=A0A674K641_9SAUR